MHPFRLQPTFSPRPWGRRSLLPWYTAAQTHTTPGPIGEAWLTGPETVALDGPHAGATLADITRDEPAALLGNWAPQNAAEHAAEFPLLIKLLFPDDKLSIQVHPNDEDARAIGQPRGKTECWYVVAAEPGATVACGLMPGTQAEQMRGAVANGTMEQLLRYIPVRVGDMVYVDAGTVHSIQHGVTLLETQQTCDTTYRLYDYGRPRELHLEQALAVAKAETAAGLVTPTELAHGSRLIAQRYFTVDRYPIAAGAGLTLHDAVGKPHALVALRGHGSVLCDGVAVQLTAGSAVVVPASAGALTIAADSDLELIRSMP